MIYMPRLGKFTSTIYDDNYDFSNCPECCVVLSATQLNDSDLIAELKAKNILDCLTCHGCPAARNV